MLHHSCLKRIHRLFWEVSYLDTVVSLARLCQDNMVPQHLSEGMDTQQENKTIWGTLHYL